MDSVLRPRDIQSRIRSGESPETVAAAAQTSVDKIMAYATPVLAERAYVAQQAQGASVRRRAGDGTIGHLAAAVEGRLSAEGIDPASVEWDAWRREDGRWTLVADFGSGESARRAGFVYDSQGRYVVAEDEESRWLVGERAGAAAQEAAAPRARAAEPWLSAVPQQADHGDSDGLERAQDPALPDAAQLPLGADTLEMITGRLPVSPAPAPIPAPIPAPAPAPEPARGDERTEDLSDTAAAVRAFGGPPAPAPPPQAGQAGQAGQAEQAAQGSAVDEVLFDASPAEEETAAESKPARKGGRSRGRASVPSWDEIMFGSGKDE